MKVREGKDYRLGKEVLSSIDNYVMQFALDGINYGLFHEMLETGKLPNIRQHLYDRPLAQAQRAFSVIPSITANAHEAYSTGKLSRHPGLRWYDRKKQRVIDYCARNLLDIEAGSCKFNPTIHHILQPSQTVFEFANKGATKKYRIPRLIARGIIPALYEIIKANIVATYRKLKGVGKDISYPTDIITNALMVADRIVAKRTIKVYKKRKLPRICTSWFFGVDEIAHANGLDNGVLARSYTAIDDYVGRIVRQIQKRGIYEKMIFTLYADHGNEPVKEGQNMNLEKLLRCEGHEFKGKICNRDYDLEMTYHGDATGYLYMDMKDKEKIPKRVTANHMQEIVDALVRSESTDIVAARGDAMHVVILANKKGQATFEAVKDEQSWTYRLSGDNVLDYSDNTLNALGDWHDLEAHLAATHFSDKPCILPSIHKVLGDGSLGRNKAPDIITIAKQGYDYSGKVIDKFWQRQAERISHHNLNTADGLCSRDAMSVPFIFAGDPNHSKVLEEPRFVEYATILDIVPTILDLLGVPEEIIAEYEFDGMSILRRDY